MDQEQTQPQYQEHNDQENYNNEGMQDLQQEQQHEEAQQESAENSKEYNFRRLEQEKREKERQLQEYKRQLEEMQQQQKKQQSQQQEQEELSPDDIPTWQQVKQYLDRYQKQVSNATAETKLKQQYSDFDQVVRQDTIAKLREQYPELAQGIANTGDMYAQGKSAYTLIKKLGLVEDQQYDQQKQKVQQNAQSPRPAQSSSHGDSPLTQANAFAEGLTEDVRRQLYKEMQEAKKRR